MVRENRTVLYHNLFTAIVLLFLNKVMQIFGSHLKMTSDFDIDDTFLSGCMTVSSF